MSAPQPESHWVDPVVRAPQALGLGAPEPAADPAGLNPVPGPPDLTAVPAEPATQPNVFRLPQSESDQEGLYLAVRWAVRAIDECGRAFTRLTGRLKQAEARLAAVEQAVARHRASSEPGEPGEPKPPEGKPGASRVETRLTSVEVRLRYLESRPRPAAPASSAPAAPGAAPVVPLRLDPLVTVLRREVAADRVRIDRLEALDRQPATTGQAKLVAQTVMAPMTERISALENDILGVYRELDGIAESIYARFATLSGQLDRVASLVAAAPPAATDEDDRSVTDGDPASARNGNRQGDAGPGEVALPAVAAPADLLGPSSLDLTPASVRAKAVSVLSAELDRIREALGVLAEVAERSG